MLHDPDQQQFREWFSELKHEDRAATPPFERQWHAALHQQQQTSPRSYSGWKIAATVALLAGIGAAALLRSSHQSVRVGIGIPRTADSQPVAGPVESSAGPAVSSASSIADWQSPTAFLLELAADEAPAERFDPSSGPFHSNKNF